MKWVVLALLLLISCAPAAQQVMTKPVANTEPVQQPPKVTTPLEPQVKAPQEVATEEPTAAPTQAPKKTSLSPQEECLQDCEQTCAATAQNACTQPGRPQCKAGCGDIIDPAACSEACTYAPRQPGDCKRLFNQFCSAQCVSHCH